MEATVSWRLIGGWLVELGGATPVPILHLIDPSSLQAVLQKQWPECKVTYDKRGYAELVVREVPYDGFTKLFNHLATTYCVHSLTKEAIKWSIGETVGLNP